MSAKTSTLSPPDLTEDTYPPPHRHSPSALSNSANPEEDWSKISDASERRRIQNRIAQRNYRKKLKERLEDLERRANILDDDWFATSLETPPGDEQTSSGTSSVAGIPRPPELNTRSHSDHEENNKLFAAHNDDKNLSKNKKEESQPRLLTKLSQGKLHDEYIHFDDYDDGNSGSEPEPHMALVDYRNTPSAHKQFAPDTRTNTQGWDKCIHHRVPFYNDIVATITRWFQYSRNKFEAALQPQIPSAHVRVSWICRRILDSARCIGSNF
ncbi:hypothetical protein TruAng_008232 [Truncatella angustata]|nr:hypothetical protein TruAng_008232 [Truncatella angustata]